MDVTALRETIGNLGEEVGSFGKKYRYVILVLVIGIGLMLLPEVGKEKTGRTASAQTQEQVQQDLAEQLQQILSQIHGVGKVEVLLSIRSGEETVYQTDEDTSDSGSQKSQTVLVTDSDRQELGLVRQTLSPQYQGAVIVCQGAENAAVRLAVVEAVADATGLGTDRISVLKMK